MDSVNFLEHHFGFHWRHMSKDMCQPMLAVLLCGKNDPS